MSNRILYVDDSVITRMAAKVVLEEKGYSVTEAEDGYDALDKVKSADKFDLFLIDLNMPKMNGLTLVKEIRKLADNKNTPIIILSGESGESNKLNAEQAGANGWITKPFSYQKFYQVVKQIIT